MHYMNEGNDIDRTEYPDEYCLFAFDLTPDLSAHFTEHWNLVKNGTIRIEVRFDRPLAKTINCVLYAEFDNVLEIDASRQVIVDFGA